MMQMIFTPAGPIIIRQVGDNIVTADAADWYVNGQRATYIAAENAKARIGSDLPAGKIGCVKAVIAGKNLYIVLGVEEVNLIAPERKRLADFQSARKASAANYDNLYNEGAEGYNPYING